MMKVRAIGSGFGLTKGKIYDVNCEYDTVYDVRCDDGKRYCRNKDFFEVVNENEEEK